MSQVSPLPVNPAGALSDETIVERLFELASQGLEGSEEYQRLDAECYRRLTRASHGPTIIRSLAAAC